MAIPTTVNMVMATEAINVVRDMLFLSLNQARADHLPTHHSAQERSFRTIRRK